MRTVEMVDDRKENRVEKEQMRRAEENIDERAEESGMASMYTVQTQAEQVRLMVVLDGLQPSVSLPVYEVIRKLTEY